MAMPDTRIRELVKSGLLRIDPFDDSSLQPAGYDLRAAQEVTIGSGEQRLLSTNERIELSPNLLGLLHLRSSLVREGLHASLALVDPGFRGQLTVSLLNAGGDALRIECGEPFLQLTIIQLSSPPEREYGGKYQGSVGVVESRRQPHGKDESKSR
ncbi:dCTP deaminase [Candidatus Bathyarchaeota archaeon]|nr:dCTP deaminase [Candidatus Bathyarchaeota archaeon]